MLNYSKDLKKIIFQIVTGLLWLGMAKTALATPTRIVSLKPNITRLLVQLGLGEQIVGFTKYCQKPNEQAQIIADYTSINVEALARLKPHFVVASKENAQERQIQQLAALGIPVTVFDFSTYTAMQSSMAEIAKLTGSQKRFSEIQKSEAQTWKSLKDMMLTKSLKGKAVVILVQRAPLMIASGNTYISTLLTEAGFRNIFENNRIAYPQINQEELARESIDFVFDLAYDTSDAAVAGRSPIRLPIDEFLAEPGSLQALEKIIRNLPNMK